MNPSAFFIRRPVATTLLTIGLALAGMIAFFQLPVAPLPQVDFPTISVQAQLPGASPEVVATSVATPLERHLGVIADVTEMTSSSTVGSARITLQFGLDRDIDGAARDVQAAINAARADLPASLRSNPTYRKVNPADSPIMILTLTSSTLTQGQIYDAASSVLQQKFSQLQGIGQVTIGGSALPAVRVELNPTALFEYGIGLEDVRAALASANAHAPKGSIEGNETHYQIYDNDQGSQASQYQSLLIAYRNGAPVRLSDVGEVVNSVENIRNAGLANGKPAVLVILYRQPGANIIDTIDRVKASLPQMEASIPSAIDVSIAMDRSATIRASLRDVERTLLVAISLVILVVLLFLRNGRATLVPSVAVPVSLIGTFGVMYLAGYSLDNLSLMALTIATGFVVDDAIVVLENISRHVEAGVPRFEAALKGAREVGFTVVSMSLSLVAVFTPILFMGGIIGRLFREFAVTLSVAILVSLVVSLTTTPMMCAQLITPRSPGPPGRFFRATGRVFDALLAGYDRTLQRALSHPRLVMLILGGTLCLNVYLFAVVPKGFFPQEDTGVLVGNIQADQSISFQLMQEKLTRFVGIVQEDPDVANVVGFTGGQGQTNGGFVFVSLKPLTQRKLSADQIIGRLRRKLATIPGAVLYLQAAQDIRMGGRQSNAQYQFTLNSEDLSALYSWVPRITQELQQRPELRDVSSDQQQNGLEADLVIDRETASRLGINASMIDNTLYDAFGQRQVSTIYNPLNQYHVVMEVAPEYWQSPDTLKYLYISTAGGSVGGVQGTNAVAGTVVGTKQVTSAASVAEDTARNLATNQLAASGHSSASTGAAVSAFREPMVPLASFTHYGPGKTPLGVNHQGLFIASTISFNLAPGKSLSDATAAIRDVMQRLGVPSSIRGSFQGTAREFQQSLANEAYLIAAALLAVYVVLGILYESYVHPVTILSTLPSAGVGAVLALIIFNMEFSVIALIGVILLIGIVKKNAIMMIDVALDAERNHNWKPEQAIYHACLLRFRPIMMTTMAALWGAVPLALSGGEGGELRRPLGIAIIGGLIVSQVLTLYTTPVVYLYLDRFRLWSARLWRREDPQAVTRPRAVGGR
ncbi:MAG TPA: efflux RND transporter permease subunit [Myxococcota bacterium]|nr:efflux RND transporter permease subunit [Myxococcota bacterium]